MLFSNGDKSTVEHPVKSARQRQPVVDGVRTLVFYRAYVCCLHLGTATTVTQIKSGNRATAVVGSPNHSRERPIPRCARNENVRPKSLQFRRLENRLWLFAKTGGCRRLDSIARQRVLPSYRAQPGRYDRYEFIKAEAANCRDTGATSHSRTRRSAQSMFIGKPHRIIARDHLFELPQRSRIQHREIVVSQGAVRDYIR